MTGLQIQPYRGQRQSMHLLSPKKESDATIFSVVLRECHPRQIWQQMKQPPQRVFESDARAMPLSGKAALTAGLHSNGHQSMTAIKIARFGSIGDSRSRTKHISIQSIDRAPCVTPDLSLSLPCLSLNELVSGESRHQELCGFRDAEL